MLAEQVTKTISTSTRVDESSFEIKTQIPESLLTHPRLQEILDHSNNEIIDAVNVLKLVHDSTSSTVDKLIQNVHANLESIPDPVQQDVKADYHVLPETFTAHVPKEERPVHLVHSSAVDAEGHNVPRKNYDIKGRQLVLISSKMLNQIHCTSHIGYTSRTKEQAIKFARNDLSKQHVTLGLSQARDLDINVLPETYSDEELKLNKRNKMLELMKDGWEVLGLLPRV